MLIELGYDIRFQLPNAIPMIAVLNVHPSRVADLRSGDILRIEPTVSIEPYRDSFGNHCSRFIAPAGEIRLSSSAVIADSGKPDPVSAAARQVPVEALPPETLRFLLASRYCETDILAPLAYQLFGHIQGGWARVQAVCDWVHSNVTFGYQFANATKTANQVLTERCGVCRDFQHLAIALCRCLHIPARYATGYLGDIGVPFSPAPMDFSAWFEVYLEDRWWTFDARHNQARIGRVLMATGRDAADVALTTSFGTANLLQFTVVTNEIPEAKVASF